MAALFLGIVVILSPLALGQCFFFTRCFGFALI